MQEKSKHMEKLTLKLASELNQVKAVWMDQNNGRSKLSKLTWKELKKHPINDWVVLQKKARADEWTESKYM